MYLNATRLRSFRIQLLQTQLATAQYRIVRCLDRYRHFFSPLHCFLSASQPSSRAYAKTTRSIRSLHRSGAHVTPTLASRNQLGLVWPRLTCSHVLSRPQFPLLLEFPRVHSWSSIAESKRYGLRFFLGRLNVGHPP